LGNPKWPKPAPPCDQIDRSHVRNPNRNGISKGIDAFKRVEA